MRTKSIAMLLACLASILVSSATVLPAGSQYGEPCDWRTYELTEAFSASVASFRITGTGRHCGGSIEITVTPSIDLNLRIRVEPGTVLHSSVPGEQDMVVRRVRGRVVTEWQIEPSVDIEVRCEETETYILEAYCLDRDEETPSRTTEFTIGGRLRGDVGRVIAVLPDYEDASIYAVQAAIWVATGDIPLSSVEGSASPDYHQAAEILNSAGIGSAAERVNGLVLVVSGIAIALFLVVLSKL